MAVVPSKQLGNLRGQVIRNVGKPKNGTDALTWALPSYTTAERDELDASDGMIIYNSTTSKLNFYSGGWKQITST